MISKIIKENAFIAKYKIYFKSTLLYLSSGVFSAVIGILVNPFMAKNLSPEDYAIMGYFNSFSAIILPVMNFSLITYFLRNYYKLPDERKQIVSDTILIVLLVYGLFILGIAYTTFYIYSLYTKLSFPIYPYALLAFIPIYLNNFLTFYLVKCRLKGEAGRYTKLMIYSGLLSTILGIVFVIMLKYGAAGRMFAALLASFATAVFCFKQLFGKLQFEFEVVKDAIRFCWPLSLSAILWYFLSGVDMAMLEKLNDSYTFGFYNVGMQMAGYFTLFYTAVSNTFEPDIYKAIAEDKKRKLVKIIGVIIALNALPNLVFILFAPLIIGLLTYNRYTDASSYAQIIALRNITITFYYSTIAIIVGYGFTKTELLIRLSGAMVCYMMYKILISNFGFYGAAWGQVFSFIILTVISLSFLFYQFQRNKRINNVLIK